MQHQAARQSKTYNFSKPHTTKLHSSPSGVSQSVIAASPEPGTSGVNLSTTADISEPDTTGVSLSAIANSPEPGTSGESQSATADSPELGTRGVSYGKCILHYKIYVVIILNYLLYVMYK